MDHNFKDDNPFNLATLVQMLQERAQAVPQKEAVIFLADGEQEQESVTYAELERRARAVAAWLQQENIHQGSQALLLFPPGLDFISAFFGCLYAGVVAVPAYPPRLNRPSPRIQAIVADSGATVALTTTTIHQGLERRFSQMPSLADLHWLDAERLPENLHDQWQEPHIDPDSLAFLQYTSGSTGSPKGVMVSHRNLMHNLEAIRQSFKLKLSDVGVFWLPNYHDMGLIGGILGPLYIVGSAVLMAPAAFLQRPVRWLEAISRYKANISGAPNFAFQLCLDKITQEQRQDLDLSSWRVAFCGAEPIRPETLNQFAATFAEQGFKKNAYYPCYGLAEGTLIVSGAEGPGELLVRHFSAHELAQNRAAPLASESDEALSLVSCGNAVLGQEIQIVDPQTLQTNPLGQVGEIWVKGPSVAQGYWHKPEINRQVFGAYPADREDGPYLRTGDLGFLFEDNLYVTGRLKDLIIIHGRNHYPQDIEYTAGRSHPALAEDMGAAFSVEVDGQEKLVIVHEVTRHHRSPDIDEVAAAVRRAVAQEHQLQLHGLVLIRHLSIPRTSSGKIIRVACKEGYLNGTLKIVSQWQADQDWPPVMVEEPQADDLPAGKGSAAISAWLVEEIARRLHVNPARIDRKTPFIDYGLDSVQALNMTGDLETWLGRPLSATLVWDFPTIDVLARHLAGEEDQPQAEERNDGWDKEPIAVVGIGCRFPGAHGPDAFWRLLNEGVDGISEVPGDRWDKSAYYVPGEDPQPGKMNTQWGGFLEHVDQFDAPFFAISPREATRMDPQQRLLLEVAWEALEHGGQNPAELKAGATGVFIGISSSDYSHRQFSSPELIDAYAGTGNAHSVAANRLSYSLDLRGPSMAIDTACSSSLVATHLAMNSLISGESDVALAGGVNLLLEPDLTITFSQARMMAADGRCKTFDARADGYVRGEGCGILVLKRLSDARRDGDNILALLHGSAVNQDGRSNGLTAPNGPAQQAVIRRALQVSGVAAEDISYIEAHGTGTPLGDPIEIQSLQMVLDGEQDAGPVMVGSVKTNIGHLESAAGVAGLIKTILALVHERIPAHLHYQELNPHINLKGSRLQISGQPRPWKRGEKPRLAGVSSFGFGGTNAHIIVGEGPLRQVVDHEPQPHLFTLSARDEHALQESAARYASYLEQRPHLSLAEVSYSANTGRAAFEKRLALTASSTADLAQQLAAMKAPFAAGQPGLKTAFLFTGQGSQFPGMGRALYESEPVFREALQRCEAVLNEELDRPLLEVIDPPSASAEKVIDQTQFTQPALFAIEYALAQLWRSWGIEPDVVMGHSVGEVVAACVAGIMSLEDGLRLIAARGRLMGNLPSGGAMAAVFSSEERAQEAIAAYSADLSLAAVNGPDSVVISGKEAALQEVLKQLAQAGIESRPLLVSHAFHSPLMDPILPAMVEAASGIQFRAPQIPFISNLNGRLLQEAPDAAYWADHVRRPVQFHAGMNALAEFGATIFLEIGPQPHLTGMGRRVLQEIAGESSQKPLWLPSLRRTEGARETMLGSLGRLFEAGMDIQWAGFYHQQRPQKVALPTYPFQWERYWFEIEDDQARRPTVANAQAGHVQRLHTAVPLFESRLDLKSADGEDLLRENSLAVAGLFWGPGQHQLLDLSLTSRLSAAAGSILTQTTVSASSAESAFIQTFGASEDGGSWHLLASGQILRGQPGAEPPPSDRASQESEDGLPGHSAPAEAYIPYLQGIAAGVLDLDAARVALNQPLETLGLDSLMAIELRNRLQSDLQIDLPVVELLQGPTIEQLAASLPSYRTGQSGAAAIQPTGDPTAPGPLSYGQQAMWVLHQLLPPEVSFNVAGAAQLHGPLQVSALRRATARLVERHGALRTTFSTLDGRPQQQVQAQMPLDQLFSEVDAAGWDEESLKRFLQDEAYRPFDLEEGPLLRLVLLRRGEKRHVLLLSLNHLITDFWSMALLIQELSQFYIAEAQGQSIDLPVPALNMADYARWQEQMLAGSQGEAHRRYWHEQLSGDLPRLDIPSDRPRPAVLTFDGGTESRQLSPLLAGKVKKLSAEQGTTLATTLLAAFQTLLHRYSGQDDLLVGTVIAGRERAELQDLAGYLINSVAIRADFSGEPAPAFDAILAQTRQTMVEAIAHQDYPLPLLAEELAAAGQTSLDPSRPPLFETMFIMQRAQALEGEGLSAFALGLPGARLNLAGLQIESLPLGGLPAQFDMTLMMAEVDDGLTAALHYNQQLFDAETMRRLLAHLEQLLEAVVEQPGRPVHMINLLPDGERHKLLHDWNDTAADFPSDKTLHQLVSEQARRTPGATALRFEGDHWTYAQLEERAAKAANRLQGLGVGRGSLVALFMERSLDMVAGLLGILQAGGAYIPLDPDFPAERLAIMLEDAQPLVLLTQESLRGKIEAPSGTAVCLIEETCQVEPLPTALQPAGPADRAYVIFTSGSTGRPKGVQISHGAAVNFLWSMSREPGICAQDHLLAVTTLSFDIALLELFLPLINGAQVTIASRELAMDGQLLAEKIQQAGISIMQATPATWQLLLEAGWQGKADLTVLCGGEALRPALAQKLLTRCAALWNMYGPTETTVWSTIARITPETEKITIGRPIANTQVYVLDQQMQPVPTGVAGQLYIGGQGLADGYLNRPDLTAERFLPDPFHQGQKLYKTGDLARYLADGRLLYLGRDDFQVKIQGYRIELGDIETAVSRHPAVAQTVCLAQEYEPGSRRLVAYVVAPPDREAPSTAELRGYLRAQLPEFMIPATFVTLDALPLLPNGKINRRALPDPSGGIQKETPFVPPRFQLEAKVAELCADVLDIDQISIHDSFFDLGGNSLLATRLIFQTREQFRVNIPLRQVFMQPTVAGLSQAILSARQNGYENGHVPGNGHAQMAHGDRPPMAQLEADAALDPAIRAKGLPEAQIENPDHVLLSGATGFVGAFLLRDLLQETQATIHCLVRAANEDEALHRVKQNMDAYGLWQDAFAGRVRAVPGDLGEPQLGMSDDLFARLAQQLDVIIHNGALVNFVYAYQEHKAPNVDGTEALLRLATSERLKAVHFVSTLSVFHSGGHDDGHIYYEQDDLRQTGVPFGGYAQSKWVGERMIMSAAARGIPVAIYRPGLVSGDSRSGAWNTADMMSTMAMACATLGAVPDLDVDVDIVPVDYVSKALLTLALGRRAHGQIYNLCNPHTLPFGQMLDLLRDAGLPLRALPFDQWRGLLMNMAQQLGGENWNPFLPLLEEVSEEQVFMPTFDCGNTLRDLSGSGVTCPPVGKELLQTYLNFLQLTVSSQQ